MFAHLKHTLCKAALMTAALALLGFTIGSAASGDLDITFSGDGKQRTDFSANWQDRARAIALQPDGKIVAVGERYDPADPNAASHNFAIARYLKNGSLDTSFSGDGKQLTDFGGIDIAFGVAVQPSDGKIVVSGQKCNSSWICDLAVARYNEDGSLDSTFSGDGRQVVPHGSGDNGAFKGLAIQPDAKIVMSGYMINSSGDNDFAVIRLNPNGSLDTSFSVDGKVNIGFGAGRHDLGIDLALRGGKIIVGGETCDAAWTCNFAVARLNSGGSVDTMFSGDGRQTTDFGANDAGYAVAVQSDGKIIVTGETHFGVLERIALARYNTDGSLDTTFYGDGKRTLRFFDSSFARDVLVQPDGKIVIAGQVRNGTKALDFVMARFDTYGVLDTTFSGDGKLMIDFAANNDLGYGLVRQADGKYVLGGYTNVGALSDFALARIQP